MPVSREPADDDSAEARVALAQGEGSTWLRGTGRAVLAAAAVAVVFLVVAIGRTGIIDPHELDRAELARRIAVHVFGAEGLAIAGDPDALPTLGDLGAGELGATSIALGFTLFGLHEWAGRLPLAIWALAGCAGLFSLLARFASPRTGLYGVIALVTMPAYFVQARTMLGDAPAMAAFALCLAGLGWAMLDDRSTARARAGLVIGLCGAAAGYLARGWLLGVAVPVGAIGLTWLVSISHGRVLGRSPRAHWVGAASLSLGLAAAITVIVKLADRGWAESVVTRAVAVSVQPMPPSESTFDLVVRDLGHALFPWSAFIPLAIAALVARGTAGLSRSEAALRVLVCMAAITSFAAHAWLAPYTGTMPFTGVAALAAIAALAIHDLDRGLSWSPAASLGVIVIAALIHRDFALAPDESLAAFGLPDAARALGQVEPVDGSMSLAAIAFAGLVATSLLAGPSPADLHGWLRGRCQRYVASARTLSQVWKGNLAFGFLLVEAVLIGVAATLVVGRRLGWASVSEISIQWARVGLNAWWLLPLGLVAIPLALDLARLGHALLLRRLRLPPAGAIAIGGLLAGAILCFAHYPAIAARLSPRSSFEAYRALRREGEPLAMLGLRTRGAHYYAGGVRVESFEEPRKAHRWLLGGQVGAATERRWLVFREQDLGLLNTAHRAHTGQNLPVLASERPILLASNQLDGAPNENPLEPFVLASPPFIQHPLDHRLGGELSVLGWSLLDERGQPADVVVAGRRYRLETYYRVLRAMNRDYEVFVHIDGDGRRHNGDHEPVGGTYPTSRWRPGDVVVDPYDLLLSAAFTPGDYDLFFGLFRGSDRLPVTRGRHDSNRIAAGALRVR